MPAAKKTRRTDAQHGVQSAETVLHVLSAFVGLEPTPTLKTLSDRLGMHRAKVHRYLVSLCRAGYVEQDPATIRYRLGPQALRLGFAAMTTVDAIRIARPMMHDICQTLNHTVVLAVWNDGVPTIALKEAAPGPLVVTATEGTAMTILRSAIGRAFGAWLPPAKTAKLVSDELSELRKAAPQPGMPRNDNEVKELFAEIRKRGLSRLTGQLVPTLHSLAAPVFDSSGAIVAVICSVGPVREFDSTWSGKTAKALLDAAATLSRGLGYRPPGDEGLVGLAETPRAMGRRAT